MAPHQRIFLNLRAAFPGAAEVAGGGGERCRVREEKPSPSPGKVVRVPAGMVPRRSAVDKEVAVRRATANKRVVEDNCGEDCARDFSMFVSSRGDTIFTQSWTPVKAQVRGVVVILHGLNEHSGRYGDFAKKLNANGLKVYGMDWIGHGGSDGLHAYVPSLDYAVNGLKMYIGKVLAENPKVPCFCSGHSTGGAIILKAVLNPKIEKRIAGIVLTSPAVGVHCTCPHFCLLVSEISIHRCKQRRNCSLEGSGGALSQVLEPARVHRCHEGENRLRDSPYNWLLAAEPAPRDSAILVLHGTNDSVTDPEASGKLHREAASTDRSIELYQGCLHDLLFEPEKEEIARNIISWIIARL